MEVVIDGMVVAEEVTMVEAWAGLITVGKGEATVVGINMFGVSLWQSVSQSQPGGSLGYYNVWVTLAVATLQLALRVCPPQLSHSRYRPRHDVETEIL